VLRKVRGRDLRCGIGRRRISLGSYLITLQVQNLGFFNDDLFTDANVSPVADVVDLHYFLYKVDVARIAALGMNAHSFSYN
jgi:hypothetical protein